MISLHMDWPHGSHVTVVLDELWMGPIFFKTEFTLQDFNPDFHLPTLSAKHLGIFYAKIEG